MYLKLLVAVQLDEVSQCVGNKAKGRNSKWMFKENKARRISRKTNIPPPPPLMRTRTCAYQGVRNVRFSENLACFVFLKHPLWNSTFCRITDEWSSLIPCIYHLQISAGLKYLHEHHIIYRDLKCDNVLVCSFPKPSFVDYMNANIKLKLTDYGISRAVAISGTKGFQGTPGFMAPEIIKYSGKETYNAKVSRFFQDLGSIA